MKLEREREGENKSERKSVIGVMILAQSDVDGSHYCISVYKDSKSYLQSAIQHSAFLKVQLQRSLMITKQQCGFITLLAAVINQIFIIRL